MARPRNTLDVGAFRYRATWQRKATVSMPGQDEGEWSDMGTFWAFETPIWATESMASDQQQALIQTKLSIRGNAPIVATDRFLFDTFDLPQRVFQVSGVVLNDRDQGYMQIACLEVSG